MDVSQEPVLQGLFQNSIVVEKKGRKIGIIGLVTQETTVNETSFSIRFSCIFNSDCCILLFGFVHAIIIHNPKNVYVMKTIVIMAYYSYSNTGVCHHICLIVKDLTTARSIATKYHSVRMTRSTYFGFYVHASVIILQNAVLRVLVAQ